MSATLHARYRDAFCKMAEALGFSFSPHASPEGALTIVLPRIAELRSQHSLPELCEALGWQGGTIHGVIAEIKRLKALDTKGKP